jgi:hypothetical protein
MGGSLRRSEANAGDKMSKKWYRVIENFGRADAAPNFRCFRDQVAKPRPDSAAFPTG